MPFIFLVFVLQILSSCTHLLEEEEKCPADMAYVYNEHKNINLCVDRYEFTSGSITGKLLKQPDSSLNYYQCKFLCKVQGKRLLNNLEWLEACEGSDPRKCNIFQAHPIMRLKSSTKPWIYRDKDCKRDKYTWGVCMNDPKINMLPRSLGKNGEFQGCVSKYGIYNMVGNLGEWIDNNHYRGNILFGQFNGGLYPQPKSSCAYKTIAHGPKYRDYSIGCRCGLDIK